MPLSLKDDAWTAKILVIDYMKHLEQRWLPANHVLPEGIINFVFDYYFIIMEKFTKVTDGLEINLNRNKIISHKNQWQSALGRIIVDPVKHPNAIYEWKIKFISELPKISIGIMEFDETKILKPWAWKSSGRYYAGIWTYYMGTWTECSDLSCERIRTGDDAPTLYTNIPENMITVIVDCSSKSVVYHINDTKDMFGFVNIDLTKQYQLCVGIGQGILEIRDFYMKTN